MSEGILYFLILGAHVRRHSFPHYGSFYFSGDILEVEYNTTEFCKDKDGRLVSSVIQFHCNQNVPNTVSEMWTLPIATDKALFFSAKNCPYFSISPQKHMLWVLIRNASPRHF